MLPALSTPMRSEEPPPFRLTPLRPLDELFAEAHTAAPPAENGRFRAPDLVDLSTLQPAPRLDLRYATSDNFLGAALYPVSRAYLQRPAAEALLHAQAALHAQGIGVLIYDAYRPWHVTKVFWDATDESLHTFVANPLRGSRHNRGCAVDIGLYDLETGAVLPMPSAYDEFSPRAYVDYNGGSNAARRNRDLLRTVMERHGFAVYEAEWWHFDYCDWAQYPILNLRLDEIDSLGQRPQSVAS